MDGLAQSDVLVPLQQEPLLHVLHEVQVLERGNGLFPLFGGRSAFVGGALQVVFAVHADGVRQQIVHDDDADVFASCLDAVQPVELW